jgi:hypothetical protein
MQQDFLTTEEFVEPLKVKPSTARRGFCVRGHYMGVIPKKLPNGRLLVQRQELFEGNRSRGAFRHSQC